MSTSTELFSGHSRTNDRMVYLLTVTLVTMLSIFALFPIRFNSRSRQRFKVSKKHLAYCMAITTIFSTIYLRQMYLDYMHGQLNLEDATKLYIYMNITVAIVNYITQMMMGKHVAKMMSNVPLFPTLQVFQIQNRTIWRSVSTSLIKVIGFPLILEISLVVQQRRYEPEISWMWTLYKLFPMIISNLLNNCYYGAMIIAKAIMGALNDRVKNQIQQVNLMQSEDQIKITTPYYRMNRFCELADELDILAEQYRIIYVNSNNYLRPMSLSLVLSLICHLLGMTVGFFVQYYNLAESLISGKKYDAFGSLINVVFLSISLAEIVMLSYICGDILTETRKTGMLLQDINYVNADCRYKQSVFAFSQMIINLKFRIKPMGLFELDMSLIVKMFSSMASFLVILVQADLWQRLRKPIPG